MRRVGVLIVILALLTFSAVNPSMTSIPAAIVDEVQEASFFTALDGDESSESILDVHETLSDDVLFSPDTMANDTENTASSGDSGDDYHGGGGNIAQTYTQNSVVWSNITTEGVGWVRLNFTFDGPDGAVIDGWSWGLYAYHQVGDEFSNYSIYNWVTGSWDYQGDIPDPNNKAWTNGSTHNSDYWSGNECAIIAESEDLDGGQVGMVYVDCGVVKFDYMTLADSAYAESFCSVSDWSAESGFAGTITTDGDVANITETTDTYCRMAHTFGSAQDFDGHYLEYRTTATTAESYRVSLYGGTNWFYVEGYGTNLGTKKGYISDATGDSGFDASAVTKIVLTVTGAGGTLGIDYLRIGPADEMGWQHDGSTTAGTDDDGNAAWTYGASSDGDILTITQTRTGSGNSWSNFKILFDTTTTSADLEQDYYSFFAIRWRCTTLTTENVYVVIYSDGEKYDGLFSTTSIFGWTTSYYNLKADSGSADSNKYIRVTSKGDAVDEQSVVEIDWTKMFSIANNTLTQSGTGADDYLYVDSGVLYSHIDDGHIVLDRDPALSVAQASYPVYNLTTSGTAPEFSQYVSSWSTYSDDTRGAVSSGTVTDIRLNFDSTEVLSAIKFIEDGTAPDADIVATPDPPDDDEQVTLSSIVFDDVEVWRVWYNAISYPTGFSDVDYSATEGQENYWSYSFSSLIAGDYCFKVIANDGANNSTVTQANRDYATVRFTVREAAITIEEITLIGAGSDFEMMTFSARINKDCSYVIYEESENNAESATHSGSVSEPSFNLAWTKLSTTDTNVNFTIRFTNGTLTYNYTSQYQVAQTALAITGDESLSQDEIVYSGTSTKACSWTLYLDDVQEDTGSIATAGSFVVNWTRTQSISPASISFAIKFYTATETVWENGTYSEYSLTAFSIQTLFMDLTDPSISAIFTTSWGNATGYLYEDDVQQDTAAEGITLSYSKSTTAGTYSVALKIDAGGEIAWYNTTYTVAVTTLQVTDDSIRTTANYAYLDGHVNLNANYTVYEETVQVGTGSVSAGSFEIRWTKASSSVENVTVLFESDSQTYPVYSGYDVAEQATFVVEQWWISLQIGLESYVEFYAHTSWENATIYVYDNTTLMVTVSELAGGASSNFWMSEVQGLHTITLNITHGATVHTRTKTYFIPDWAVSGLSLRWSLYTFQDNYTMLSLESNWRNCSYSVYLNGSEVATSANDPVTLNFTRAINIGEYNLTIFANGGTQTYTIKNIRYIITEEGVSYDYSSVTGGRSVAYGDNYYEYYTVTDEPAPGILIDQGTATIVSVGGFLIIFVAFLAARELQKREILKTERVLSR